MSAELLTGDAAPPFRAVAVGAGYPPEGAEITLDALRGRRTVLCFYPEEDTPGWTEQACALRDAWDELRRHAQLFGVNDGSPESHRRFIERYALPFPLLSDAGDAMAKAYGLWLADGGGGDVEGGAATERSTFVIGADGCVERKLSRVEPTGHADLLLDILRACGPEEEVPPGLNSEPGGTLPM